MEKSPKFGPHLLLLLAKHTRDMDVSKNRGGKPPKMDGFIRENPIKIDDLGVSLFLETPICRSLSMICG